MVLYNGLVQINQYKVQLYCMLSIPNKAEWMIKFRRRFSIEHANGFHWKKPIDAIKWTNILENNNAYNWMSLSISI